MSEVLKKFDIKAKSLVAKTSSIVIQRTKAPPRVFYSSKAYRKIHLAVASCDKEVGWLGTVEAIGLDYLIKDIFVPKQKVTMSETDISAESFAELAMLVENPEELFYWGHSHVNMGVSPSGQDETQVEEYLEHCDVFIRGIYNKRGESKVDVFVVPEGVVHECVSSQPLIPDLTKEAKDAFKLILEENVKDAYPSTYPSQYSHYNQRNQNGGSHQNTTDLVVVSSKKKGDETEDGGGDRSKKDARENPFITQRSLVVCH